MPINSGAHFEWLFHLESSMPVKFGQMSEPVWIDSILHPESTPVSFHLSKDDVTGDVHVSCNSRVLVLDSKRGVVKKALCKETDGNGKSRLVLSLDVTKFHQKDGWLFPVEIVSYLDGEPHSRERIDPDSLGINRPFLSCDFSLRMPAGIKIHDTIHGFHYVSGREMVLGETAGLENDLRNLVERVRSDINPENPEGESKAKKMAPTPATK
ncbi:MAG: hypothetical protein LBG65_07860 [Puniceicoccales bacterium]|nr:hypothetical protein [Puniceicoccales bacterium]